MYRHITQEEKQEFRAWARMNYQPFSTINGTWHPEVQLECIRINHDAECSLTDRIMSYDIKIGTC